MGGGLAPRPADGLSWALVACNFGVRGKTSHNPRSCVDDRGGGRAVNESLKRTLGADRGGGTGGRGCLFDSSLSIGENHERRSWHGRRRGAKGAHQGPAARSARSAPSAAQRHRGAGRSCHCSRRAACHGAEVGCTEPKRGVSGTAAGPAVGPAVAYASPRSAALPAAAAVRSGIPVVASGAACGTVRQERDSLSGGTSCVTATAARSGGIAAR